MIILGAVTWAALAAVATVVSARRQGRRAAALPLAAAIGLTVALAVAGANDDEVEVVGKFVRPGSGAVGAEHVLQIQDGDERIDLGVTQAAWSAFEVGQKLGVTRRDGHLESVELFYRQPAGFGIGGARGGACCC